MSTTSIQNIPEAKAVADIVKDHIKPELIEVTSPDGIKAQVLILPQANGLTAASVKKYTDEVRRAPERREGTAELVELESFVAHVNRFKDGSSALFADPDHENNGGDPTLTAVLDYHHGGTGAARFGKHRARYAFPVSEEWTAWTAKNGAPMAQAEFAAFLEDRIIDVADPESAFSSARKFAESLGIPSFASPSRLLSLSRGLSVHVEEKATTKVNLNTGETTAFFESQHNDEVGAPLEVPRAFLIQIPVFRGGSAVAYQLAVRLRYRVAAGRITWSYELHASDKAFEDAFREACEVAREKTELPLFYGTPE